MSNNSSDESVVSSDESVSSSDDSGSSGDGSVSNHGVSSVGSDGGDMSNSVGDMGLLSVDRDMDSLVDRGGVRGDHSLGRVHVVCGVVNVGSLNNLLDRVDLVGGRDGDSPGHGNLVRPGDMDGDIDIVVLDIDLGDDVGLLGSDPGVGPHGRRIFCWTTVSAGAGPWLVGAGGM